MVNLDFATVKLKFASRVSNMDGLGSFFVSLGTTLHGPNTGTYGKEKFWKIF
jgi:hypothetical protein